MIWEKPKARQIGSRWQCEGRGWLRFGATMDEAYQHWAAAAGIPAWLAKGRAS